MWNGLNAALWCRIINLDQHRLPACRKNITLKENHPSLTRMGTKGRSSIYNQWNPSLVWASPSLQRTSLGCFPRQTETPCMCRRCWKWSAETCAVPRSVLHGWIWGWDHSHRSWDCPRQQQHQGTEGDCQSCASCNLRKTFLDSKYFYLGQNY